MAHLDTNDNQAYDFLDTEGAEDGPYIAAGGPVMDAIDVMVEDDGTMDDDGMDDEETGDDEEMSDDGMDDDGMVDDDTDEESADDDGPGFGIVAALVALVAAGLFALRHRS